MRSDNPPAIRLVDYRPPAYLVDHVALTIALAPEATRVDATLMMRPNPAAEAGQPLMLDGEELALLAIAIDGTALDPAAFTLAPGGLTIPAPPQGPFTLTMTTEINPSANTRLMGLYRSNGVYCTQCEADGFRRITFFPDRPDVMAAFRVRLEADKAANPLLLSNGNPIEQGDIPGTERHFAVWDDPFPKPCYLFALVAGDLGAVSDRFVTRSGRDVALNVYVERGKEHRAAYAMDALKRSFAWEEEVFDREYDLDVFNIVAVSDFNMGAMENKGLNIFNDRYILASEGTATDQDYHNIEAVVAHEYFHNWTGNRITCRDWFQLCLKEGLTVFRDQEFSSDMRSRPVERIANVQTLRATQFVEDQGPLAHPVRPSEYREVNNFYTATVYNKGAEVIRMLKTLIGDRAFKAGMDLYFARHDGEAATVENFVQCFSETSGRDLSQFMLWYKQAGTPTVSVREEFDAARKTYRLRFVQSVPPTPGQPDKAPMVIPIAYGLIDKVGAPVAGAEAGVFVLDGAEGAIEFVNIAEKPIPSLFRGFSAPVKVALDLSEHELLTLAACDGDSFNRYEALVRVAHGTLKRAVADIRSGRPPESATGLAGAFGRLVAESATDRAFAALALALPSEADVAREIGTDVDPDAIGRAIDGLQAALGAAVADAALGALTSLPSDGAFSPDAASAGARALRGRLLRLLVAGAPEAGIAQCRMLFENARTMTDRVNAMVALARAEGPDREAVFAEFEARYGHDPLIMDTWFSAQATIPGPETLARVRKLMDHKVFTLANPNRTRALIGAFVNANPRGFHAPDGSGYAFLADILVALDPRNPQVSARLATAFRTWRVLEPRRRALAETVLNRLAAREGLSRDLRDILDRALAPA